jgi:hypothetical protein
MNLGSTYTPTCHGGIIVLPTHYNIWQACTCHIMFSLKWYFMSGTSSDQIVLHNHDVCHVFVHILPPLLIIMTS